MKDAFRDHAALRRLYEDCVAFNAVNRSVRNLRFGPFGLELSFSNPDVEELLMESMNHAATDEPGENRIVIADFAGDEPASFRDITERLPDILPYIQAILRSAPDESGPMVAWRPHSRCFEAFDPDTGNSLLAFADHRIASPEEWVTPLRFSMHHLSIATPFVIAHGASLHFEDTGLLLSGIAGAGKSTTTARAIQNGFRTAGDDVLMIETTGTRPMGYGLYSKLKLFPDVARTLQHHDRVRWTDIYTHGHKVSCRIDDLFAGAFRSSIALDAILVPRIVATSGTEIVPVSRAQAMRALASSLVLARGGEAPTLRKLAALLRTVPVYALEMGSDPDRLFESLRSFCRNLENTAP